MQSECDEVRETKNNIIQYYSDLGVKNEKLTIEN